MDKSLIGAVIRNRRFTLFFTFLAVVLGLYSYYVIPKQESPDVTAPFALIQTIYPGANPEDVEKLVTKPIEAKAAEVPGYKTSTSYSRNSVSVVVLELHNDADVERAWTELRRKMEDVQRDLPAECSPVQVDTNLAETAGIILSLSGDAYSYEELADFADRFKEELGKTAGVERFDIEGLQKKVARVEVYIPQLNQYAVSLEDVLKVLKAQNLQIPSGSLSNGNIKVNVNTPGIFASLSDIENTVVDVSRKTGALVRVKDIATVSWALADANYRISANGHKAILLSGYFAPNKNIVLIGQDLRRRLDQLKQQMPPGLTVGEVIYQPQEVQRNVAAFFESLLEGIALVLVVVFLGMGAKNAVVASTAVPLSILLAFTAMYLLGIRINEVSIAGLIISLGMLVDDAIVIIDAIQVSIDEGLEKMAACVQGTRRVILPVFTSTLTTAAAFAPMLFVPGPAGEFLRSLPLVVILAVGASFLVAVFVTPILSYLLFDRLKPAKLNQQAPVRRFYQGFLRLGLRRRPLTLAAAALALALAAALGLNLRIMFFPKADKDIFYINVKAETSANLDNTARVAHQVEEILTEQHEVVQYTTAVGGGLPKFYITLAKATPSQDFAQILVQVNLQRGGRFRSNQEMAVYLQDLLDRRLIGGSARVELLQKAFPGTPLNIQVSSPDQAKLRTAVGLIRRDLAAIPGTLNVTDDLDSAEYEFTVAVDNDKAMALGLTNYDIQRQINIALKGAEASVLRKSGNAYSIIVASDIHSAEELGNLAIKSSLTGSKILLKQVAAIHLAARMPTIKKYDGTRAITVSGEVKPGYSALAIEKALRAQLVGQGAALQGVSLTFKGEAKDIRDNFGSLGTAALFTLFAIYVLLMLQFRSFLQPLIIFITIPLSLIGVVLGLFIFRQPLSFTALVGVVSLMGVVIRNAILLIEFTNGARRAGLGVEAACFDAVSKRYRPIFLGAMTTVIGLVPLALSGSNLFVPLAVALMCGLTVSTLLTLVIIPVVYSAMYRGRQPSTQPAGTFSAPGGP